jgi:hypothetical protein
LAFRVFLVTGSLLFAGIVVFAVGLVSMVAMAGH